MVDEMVLSQQNQPHIDHLIHQVVQAGVTVSYRSFLLLHAFSNGAVMPSLDVRLSVCLSVCDVGEQ